MVVLTQENGFSEEGDHLTPRGVCVWYGEYSCVPGSFWKLVAL